MSKLNWSGEYTPATTNAIAPNPLNFGQDASNDDTRNLKRSQLSAIVQ